MIKFSPLNENILASASSDGSVSIWDLSGNTVNNKTNINPSTNFNGAHTLRTSAIAFSPRNQVLLCSASLDH
jgi:WD40 repeat protein